MKPTGMKKNECDQGRIRILFSLVVIFILLTTTTHLFAATATYVPNSSTGLTYEGEANNGAFNAAENQFTAGEYTIVSTDGADYVQDDSTTLAKFQYHRSDYTIAEDVNSITQVTITWKGFGGSTGLENSFTGDTLVSTTSGPIAIEKLYEMFKNSPEELPRITLIKNGAAAEGHIRNVFQYTNTDPILVLKLSNGSAVRLTPHHQVLIDPDTDTYLRADELAVGTKLVSATDEEITVTAIETVTFEGYVYDITVEEFHNFFLEAGIFVHNTQALGSFGHSLWVKESGVWTKKTFGSNPGTETLSVVYNSNFSNIISSGHLHVAAQSDYSDPGPSYVSAINTYYFAVVVTYTAADPNVITSTADTNTIGTLRYALANVTAGQTITFEASIFPSGTPATINVTSALPSLTAGTVTVDATSRGVILNGSGAGAGVDGLTLASSGNIIKNLQIKSFTDDGIQVTTSGNTIQNCQIYSNTGAGIEFTATAGGTTTIKGNYIGTNSAFANLTNGPGDGTGDNGIYVNTTASADLLTIGGTAGGDANYICWHDASGGRGIYLLDGSATVIGNYIGTNSSGANLGNSNGIIIGAWANTVNIGGVNAGEGNTIGFGDVGIDYAGGTTTISIKGNYIGTDSSWRNLGPSLVGIQLGGGSNITIGGTTAASANFITFVASGSGIIVNDGAPTIQGNYIGTNAAGASLGNAVGIQLNAGADGVVIGGTASGAGNIISRNTGDGIYTVSTGTTLVIQGNSIGTDSAGTASWPNGGDGIQIGDTGLATGTTTIGNASEAKSNIIGPNTGFGINVQNTGTVTFAAIVDINDDVNFFRGTANLGSATIRVFGNWTTNALASHTAGSSTVIFDGTTTQSLSAPAKPFANITIDNSGTQDLNFLAPSANLDINGALRLIHGGLDLTNVANPNLTLAGNLTIDATAYTILRGSGTWTFDGFSLVGATITDNTAGVNLGDIILNRTQTFEPGDANVTYLGSSVIATSITVDGTADSYDTLYLSDSGSELTLTGNGTPLSLSGNAVFNAGLNSRLIYAPAGTTGVTVAAVTYHNVRFNKASNIFSLGGPIIANGSLNIVAGTLDTVLSSNYAITVGGGWSNNDTFICRQGTVTLNGSTAPVSLNSGGSDFWILTINKSQPTHEVDVITNSLKALVELNITSGTLDFNGTALNLSVWGSMTFGANGRFFKGTGWVDFLQSGAEVYTDNSSNGPQNIGNVQI